MATHTFTINGTSKFHRVLQRIFTLTVYAPVVYLSLDSPVWLLLSGCMMLYIVYCCFSDMSQPQTIEDIRMKVRQDMAFLKGISSFQVADLTQSLVASIRADAFLVTGTLLFWYIGTHGVFWEYASVILCILMYLVSLCVMSVQRVKTYRREEFMRLLGIDER